MADKALISEFTWRSLKMQKDAFPNMPHYILPDDSEIVLRQTTRRTKTVLHVISLAIIADKEKDFLNFMRFAWNFDFTIASINEGIFKPSHTLNKILAVWKVARKNGAAKIGAKISADRKKYYSERQAEKIKDRWSLPSKEWPTKVLLEEAHISLNTAKAWLGKRPIAQYNYQAKLKRKAAKDAKR